MLHRPLEYVHRFRASSGRVRFHQYTRGALYFFAAMELALITTWALAMPERTETWVRVLVMLVGTVHAGIVLRLTRDGLRTYLHGAPRPDRVLVAALSVTLLGGTMALLLVATDRTPQEAATTLSWFSIFFVGPALLALPLRQGIALAAVPVTVASLGALALGLGAGVALATLGGIILGSFFIGGSFRASAWTMRVVEELSEAQETRARLAVAEERLRFGRDMHDVLGRNLSVIALKSELAVQLSQRGSPSAMDQMTEVQRIARESQQEMRAVLRGYREADLSAEIAGARGVLEAAGISCLVHTGPELGDGLSTEVRTALGWVVREGATNVLRHSDAHRCTLRLDVDEARGLAVLTMENDGAPGGPARHAEAAGDEEHGAGTEHGSGLSGLRERLTAVQGTLTARTIGRDTFLLTARIPCQATE